jgi:hypothetical protein
MSRIASYKPANQQVVLIRNQQPASYETSSQQVMKPAASKL